MISSRPLRAPQQDGAIVAEPPLQEAGDILQENRRRLTRGGRLLGRDWNDLRREARRTATATAADYLRRAGEPVPAHAADSLVLAGHQPELVHPGVWVKHFALQGLARKYQVTPINLVVDNDTVKSTAVRLPGMVVPPPPIEVFQPALLSVPFDRWTRETPYEERTVLEEELFRSFPERARQNWGYTPLLPDYWAEVQIQARRTPLLGERLVAARRCFERRWGCHNLELPVSLLCGTEPFAWFACHLLANLGTFHTLYNRTVGEYRRQHGIRSRNHPVPDLAAAEEWLEAPFWAWKTGQGRRGRLFVRQTEAALELRSGADPWPALPLPRDGSRAAVEAWLGLEKAGFKVRSRALTNTLYARLFLADLFIHGIGGGIYDELTDELIRAFYLVEPPVYLVLSATLLLPLPHYPATVEECRRLGRELRDVHWNPQRHLAEATQLDDNARGLAEDKQRFIEGFSADGRPARRLRFETLRKYTECLRAYLTEREQQLRAEWDRCRQQLRANEILRRRDYAFCLYPEAPLRSFLGRFL